jgi:hypothetical protein
MISWSLRAAIIIIATAPSSWIIAQQIAASDDGAGAPISARLSDAAIKAMRERDYDGAILRLREAIIQNPRDAGATYEPTAVRNEDISSHGRSQVLKMIADRPLMGTYLDKSDELWNWAALKFSINIVGTDLEWDPTPTDDPQCPSQVHLPHPGDPGRIRIRDIPSDDRVDKAAAFDWLWSHLVYELHNFENAAAFEDLYDQVREKKIDGEQFVKEMFEIELKTDQPPLSSCHLRASAIFAGTRGLVIIFVGLAV